ncbi:hypothetical protein EMCRGX_G030116 [Ephydatia muelleri]
MQEVKHNLDNIHMLQAVTRFNAQVHPQESTTAEAVLACPPLQRALSKKHALQSLLSFSSLVNKAQILLVSTLHAGSWISAIPSTGLDLHLDSAECQVALRWWLGLDTSGGSLCPLCLDIALDPLGHHAATCRHGGDVVSRHNRLQDIFANFCHRAHLSVQVQVGYGLARDHINCCPADILVQGWDWGKPAAFDVTVTSPLTPVSLNNASASVGAAAYAAECRKHAANDTRCQELGWLCIPLAVETPSPNPKCCLKFIAVSTCPGEVCGKGHHGKGSCPRVAWCGLAEKLVHGLCRCILEHGEDDDFVACKVDLRNAFNEGIQQREPFGSTSVLSVLHKLVRSIASDSECSKLLFNLWYLDDGTLACPKATVNRAILVIQQGFPANMKMAAHEPNFAILGVPIGDVIFCAKFLAQKWAMAVKFLSQLLRVGFLDPQIALLLICQCASFCKLVHLARSMPPSLVSEGLVLFDEKVHRYFSNSLIVLQLMLQVQLSLSTGGLGLIGWRSIVQLLIWHQLSKLVVQILSMSSLYKLLPYTIAWFLLQELMTINLTMQLCLISSPAHCAHLLLVSSHHASSWLAVIPSRGLNLSLEPEKFQVALKWWLGMDTSSQLCCPYCPDHQLDCLGHHAVTCKGGDDCCYAPQCLEGCFSQFCYRARLGGQLEIGHGSGADSPHSQPADILVSNWMISKPAAFDLMVVSPLNSNALKEA